MVDLDTFNFDDYKNRILLCANGRYTHALNSRLGKLNTMISKLRNSGDDLENIKKNQKDIQIIINEIEFFVNQYKIEQHYDNYLKRNN